MKLIMLPGLDGTGELFSPLIDYFPEDFSFQVISYPNTQILSYVQLVEHVMGHLPVDEDYILLAESFAGPLAYKIAQSKSKHLKQIIFVASFIQIPNRLLELTRLIPVPILMPKQVPLWMLKVVVGSRAKPLVYKLVQQAINKVPKKVWIFRINEMRRWSPGANLIDYPCVYLQAKNDRLVSKSAAETIRVRSKSFELYQVEGSHFVLQVNPRECADRLVEIMKNIE